MSFESSFLDWVDDQNAFFRALSMMPFYLTTFVGAVVVIVLVILITQDMGSWLFAAIIMYFLVTSYEWAQVLCCLIALVLAALIIWVEDW
jgi:cell division protein FtsW (lipid II flippase)